MTPPDERRCPCGTGETYGACCGRFHRSDPAPTAQALMRSRFTAFAIGNAEYLLATWHPRTRPSEVVVDELSWNRLDILDVVAGGPFDSDGIIEFRAHHRRPVGSLHERSRFVREGGRWYYVDGDVDRS